MNYREEYVSQVAAQIVEQGYRAFIAERGDYGFFTDADGTRVVSFSAPLGVLQFSGNYKTSEPQRSGTGWRLMGDDVNCDSLFNESAPKWAVGGATWRYTTLAEHMKMYQSSSKFVEVFAQVAE